MNKLLLALGVNGVLAIQVGESLKSYTNLTKCGVDGSDGVTTTDASLCTESGMDCHPDHFVCLPSCTTDTECEDNTVYGDYFNVCGHDQLCMIGAAHSCHTACANGECDLCYNDRECGEHITCDGSIFSDTTLASCVQPCNTATMADCQCLYHGLFDSAADMSAYAADQAATGIIDTVTNTWQYVTHAVTTTDTTGFAAIKTQATEAVDSAKQQVNLALDSAKTKANNLLETATQKLVVAKEHLVSPVKEAEVVAN